VDTGTLHHIVPVVANSTVTFEKLSGTSISTISLSTITLNNNITDITTGYFKTLNADTSILHHIVPVVANSTVTFEKLSGTSISHVSTLNTNLTDETNGFFSTFHSNTLYTNTLSTSIVVTDTIQPITAGNQITFEKLSGQYVSTSYISTSKIVVGDTNTANIFGGDTKFKYDTALPTPIFNSLRITINGETWLIPIQKV
jgi:hypothetical protein